VHLTLSSAVVCQALDVSQIFKLLHAALLAAQSKPQQYDAEFSAYVDELSRVAIAAAGFVLPSKAWIDMLRDCLLALASGVLQKVLTQENARKAFGSQRTFRQKLEWCLTPLTDDEIVLMENHLPDIKAIFKSEGAVKESDFDRFGIVKCKYQQAEEKENAVRTAMGKPPLVRNLPKDAHDLLQQRAVILTHEKPLEVELTKRVLAAAAKATKADSKKAAQASKVEQKAKRLEQTKLKAAQGKDAPEQPNEKNKNKRKAAAEVGDPAKEAKVSVILPTWTQFIPMPAPSPL
jgi:hypothetical protein